MTPKDVLLVVESAREQGVFAAAKALCKRWSPHLTCLQLVEIPDPRLSGAVFTSGVWAEMTEEAHKRAGQERAAIVKRLSEFEALNDVFTVEAALVGLARTVAERALHADLTIMERSDHIAGVTVFEAALFESGRPVLLVPPEWNSSTIGRRVMVAWSGKRESARALADAAPFLEGAEQVSVVAVDASPAYQGDTFAGYDISTHLARHGLEISLRQPDSFGRTAARALLDEARDCGADLIVMGGYGHSRLREFILGGVTRDLTSHCPVPILISH